MVFGNGGFDWQILVLLGCLSGFLSGLLGIGGGLILVPGLIVSLPYFGIDGPELAKIAMATSLALIIPTSMASLQAHASNAAVDARLFALLGPSIFAGAVVAPIFAPAISSTFLTALFVCFAVYTALKVMRGSSPAATPGNRDGDRPGLIRITLTGLFGGSVSSLLGLGVSWFTVPVLERFGPMPRAIGTSAALCLPMAGFGLAGFVLAPTPAECPSGCSGYVYLPAVAAIGISAVLAAPMGARLTHVLPVRALRSLFALFLIAAAASLTWKSLPVAATANDARILIAQLLAPDLVAAPIAAEAPGWLDVSRSEAHRAMATRYGPRRAFLRHNGPVARRILLTQLAPPAGQGVAGWYRARILEAQPRLKDGGNTDHLAIPLPERAIRSRETLRPNRQQPAGPQAEGPAKISSARPRGDGASVSGSN
jgi:uncharacterized membrane protein YfcA